MATLGVLAVKRHYARLARKGPPDRLVRALRRLDARPRPREGRGWRLAVEDIAGLGCVMFRPTTVTADGPPVLYLHAGGYVSGPLKGEPDFVGRLARLAGRTVVMPDYPLSPETPWRESQAAVFAVYRALNERANGPVDVVGMSAGGGLAPVLALLAAAAEAPRPGQLVLISPWVDLTMAGTEVGEYDARDPVLSIELMHAMAAIHAGGDDPADPRLSPVHADLSRLPPTSVIHTTSDVLYAGSAEFVRRATAAGVAATDHVRHGVPHCHVIARFVPEARWDAIAIAGMLRR